MEAKFNLTIPNEELPATAGMVTQYLEDCIAFNLQWVNKLFYCLELQVHRTDEDRLRKAINKILAKLDKTDMQSEAKLQAWREKPCYWWWLNSATGNLQYYFEEIAEPPYYIPKPPLKDDNGVIVSLPVAEHKS
jgi:hypothetical protein